MMRRLIYYNLLYAYVYFLYPPVSSGRTPRPLGGEVNKSLLVGYIQRE